MSTALELKNVSKHYDDFALKNITFSLPSGCIMGLIGENGAGKSTTIKLILDLISRDGGTITILGKDNKTDQKLTKEHIGVVMDECLFPENLKITDITLTMNNIYKTWNKKTFDNYIKRFSLPTTKPIKDFSRGMKMKLSIAVALSHDAKLLILDEATSGLDPIVRDEILDVFLEFTQEEDHAILLSSHITSDLEKICDYITFIHKGQIIFTEIKDELLETYGILKCTKEAFQQIDPSIIKGFREHQFGIEALVNKNELDNTHIIDRATLEDIMLYYVKENRK